MVGRKLRKDTQRTRNRILDALGDLIRREGVDFSLPDLARESGVATATVYRHFDDARELRDEYYLRSVNQLMVQLEGAGADLYGLDLYVEVCRRWVDAVAPWARTGTLIRSSEGFLERARAGNDLILRLRGLLGRVLDQLAADGVIPEQNHEYATLLWITLFDERVIVDLTAVLEWDLDEVSARLGRSLLGALSASATPGGSPRAGAGATAS